MRFLCYSNLCWVSSIEKCCHLLWTCPRINICHFFNTAGEPPRHYADGGVSDRIGYESWKLWTAGPPISGSEDVVVGEQKVIVHEVQSSSSRPSFDTTQFSSSKVLYISTPRPNASFFSLKDFDQQCTVAYAYAMKAISLPSADNFLGIMKV